LPAFLRIRRCIVTFVTTADETGGGPAGGPGARPGGATGGSRSVQRRRGGTNPGSRKRAQIPKTQT